MNQLELEYLHQQGKILDWWYYQQSNKPIWLKWQEQTDAFYEEIKQRQKEKDQAQQLEQSITQQIEEVVETTINDLFSDFQ